MSRHKKISAGLYRQYTAPAIDPARKKPARR